MSRVNNNSISFLSLNNLLEGIISSKKDTSSTPSFNSESSLKSIISLKDTISDLETTGQGVWVTKNSDSKKISENLLREVFGFEESDIQAYKDIYGDYKISDTKACKENKATNEECSWATADQIKNWQTSPDGKKIYLSLPQSTAKFLHDFKSERLAERLTALISDPQLRESAEKNLKLLISSNGEKRIAAFISLSQLLNSNKSADEQIFSAAVKTIVKLPGNEKNPFFQILYVKTDVIRDSGIPSMGAPDTGYQSQIHQIIQNASGIDEKTGLRNENNALSRNEMVYTNREAANISSSLGNKSDARYYTILARFNEVDDGERIRYEKSFEFLETLPRLKSTDSPAMYATSPETQALRRFNEESQSQSLTKELAEDPQKREWKMKQAQDGKGSVKTESEKRFYIEGSLRPEGIQAVKGDIYLNEKGREVKKGGSYYRKMPVTINKTNEREDINIQGTTRAMGVSGGVAAIEEVNKWGPFLADLYYGTTAKRVATKLKLEKEAFNAENFPIPPKPERVKQIKRELLTQRFQT